MDEPNGHRRGVSNHQPPGFYVVCLAVLCERWAAYMLASSVVLMLCQRYGYPQDRALRLAGLINAASYLGTLPGGLLADKVLGHRQALSISAVLLAVGYGLLVLAAPWALWLSLAFLTMGGSLFKPSTQAMIAWVYPSGDARLEGAQIRFYMAVNAGAAIGSVVSGLVVRRFGWSAAFWIACAVVLQASILLAVKRKSLPLSGESPERGEERPESRAIRPRRRAISLGLLMLAFLLYVLCYSQVEGSLVLWAQERTDRVVHGFEIPAAWFVAFPAILVLVLARAQLAVIEPLKRRLGTYGLVAAGLGALALAFVALIPAAMAGASGRVSMVWLTACLSLMVVGEVLIAPLGLALVLRFAPARFVGLVAGGWYVCGAVGSWLAGEVGALWARSSPLGGLVCLASLPLCGSILVWLVGARRDR